MSVRAGAVASWRRCMLVTHVLRAGLRSGLHAGSRGPTERWNRYWSGVRATGDGGDVIWDSDDPRETQRYLGLLAEHADPRLPVVDVGCGNGRVTRALAERFPRAVGVDLSTSAVARARAESSGRSDAHDARRPEFRTLDMTRAGAAVPLAAELGASNVFIRGVLHVLSPAERRRLAANVLALTGGVGTVLVAETNHPGPLLGYLESLGGGPRGLPDPLAWAITAGIPSPRPFGAGELRDCFRPDQWEPVVLDDAAEITAVPMQRVAVPERIPAYLAVLRSR